MIVKEFYTLGQQCVYYYYYILFAYLVIISVMICRIFNQYDANMLEKLSYDDKVAEVVQRQSGGRPSYCDSRYYRAVANGGQGCNDTPWR